MGMIKGFKHSKKTKGKISIANIGKHQISREHRKKMNFGRIGIKFSKEHKRNISKSLLGKSSGMLGKKQSKE